MKLSTGDCQYTRIKLNGLWLQTEQNLNRRQQKKWFQYETESLSTNVGTIVIWFCLRPATARTTDVTTASYQ